MGDKVPLPISPFLDVAVQERIADRERQAARSRPHAATYEAHQATTGWQPRRSLRTLARAWATRALSVVRRHTSSGARRAHIVVVTPDDVAPPTVR